MQNGRHGGREIAFGVRCGSKFCVGSGDQPRRSKNYCYQPREKEGVGGVMAGGGGHPAGKGGAANPDKMLTWQYRKFERVVPRFAATSPRVTASHSNSEVKDAHHIRTGPPVHSTMASVFYFLC